jgi:pimeloyl-ACP methyl ester carboxylesterase
MLGFYRPAEQITKPALLISATNDIYFPLFRANEFANKLRQEPGGCKHKVIDADHGLFYTRQEEIQAFITENYDFVFPEIKE